MLNENSGYLSMSFSGPFWGNKVPFEYRYPNGRQRALYSSRSIYTPFKDDDFYKKGGFEFRSRAEVEAETFPPFFYERLEDRAHDGHIQTQYFLGYLYMSGDYVPKDEVKARKYYEMAAAQGQVDAQYYLGVLLKDIDLGQSTDWYFEAAKQGDGRAMYAIGTIYYNGIEGIMERDFDTAFKFFEMGDEVGNWMCQFVLGSMYENGVSVKADRKKAIQLYKKSARQGYKRAIERLNELGK